MQSLTDDEFTVLMIAAEGESIAAIGRWEKPIDALVERGLMRRGDKFNNVITPAGRMSVEKEIEQRDKEVVAAFQKVAQVPKDIPAPLVCVHAQIIIVAGGAQVVCKDCGQAWVKKPA